jgi:hypothetical protein
VPEVSAAEYDEARAVRQESCEALCRPVILVGSRCCHGTLVGTNESLELLGKFSGSRFRMKDIGNRDLGTDRRGDAQAGCQDAGYNLWADSLRPRPGPYARAIDEQRDMAIVRVR